MSISNLADRIADAGSSSTWCCRGSASTSRRSCATWSRSRSRSRSAWGSSASPASTSSRSGQSLSARLRLPDRRPDAGGAARRPPRAGGRPRRDRRGPPGRARGPGWRLLRPGCRPPGRRAHGRPDPAPARAL